LWSQPDKQKAEAFLEGWAARARSSNVLMLKCFANTLVAHKNGLLAWIIRFQQALWRVPTTRSRQCKNKPAASEIWNFLNLK